MSSVAFTDFFPDILPFVVGCPDPTAINAIRNTCINFCSQTNVWQETQDAESVTANSLPYDLTGPSQSMVIQIMSCKVDGILLDPVTLDYLDSRFPNWEDTTGSPHFYFKPNTAQLSLYPLPERASVLRLRVSYAPTRDSLLIDSAIRDNNTPVIASGALAALLMIPGQSWSDPKLALYHAAIYAAGVTETLNDTQKSFSRARNRVRSHPF